MLPILEEGNEGRHTSFALSQLREAKILKSIAHRILFDNVGSRDERFGQDTVSISRATCADCDVYVCVSCAG